MRHLLDIAEQRALFVVEQLGTLLGRNLGNLLSAIAAHLHHWRVLVEFVIRPNDLGGAEDGKLTQLRGVTASNRIVKAVVSEALANLGAWWGEREIDDGHPWHGACRTFPGVPDRAAAVKAAQHNGSRQLSPAC